MDSSEDMEKEYEPIIKIDYSKGAPSNRVSLMWEIKEELDKNSAAVSKAELDGTASREKVEFKNRDSTNAEEHQVKSEPPENEADSVELRKQWLSYNSKEELKTDRDVGDKSIGAAINEGIAANQSTSVGGQPLNFICSDDWSPDAARSAPTPAPMPCEVMLSEPPDEDQQLHNSADQAAVMNCEDKDKLPEIPYWVCKSVAELTGTPFAENDASFDKNTFDQKIEGDKEPMKIINQLEFPWNPKVSTFKCPELMCEKRFVHKSNLARHVRIHTNEKPFECQVCLKRFAQKTHLTLHIRTHTKEKPYECQYCGRKFAVKSNLTGHIKTHTKEKPFRCQLCHKGFKERSDLTRHIRTHTKEKPYHCAVCERKFVQKSHLTVHIRTHTNEKPLQCHFCDKRFAHKSSLNHHLRTHTKEKPYSCEVCGKGFAVKSNMTKHVKIHSRAKPTPCITERTKKKTTRKVEKSSKPDLPAVIDSSPEVTCIIPDKCEEG